MFFVSFVSLFQFISFLLIFLSLFSPLFISQWLFHKDTLILGFLSLFFVAFPCFTFNLLLFLYFLPCPLFIFRFCFLFLSINLFPFLHFFCLLTLCLTYFILSLSLFLWDLFIKQVLSLSPSLLLSLYLCLSLLSLYLLGLSQSNEHQVLKCAPRPESVAWADSHRLPVKEANVLRPSVVIRGPGAMWPVGINQKPDRPSPAH